MLATCLITTATLGLQPTWFTPLHLFWAQKLLYFVFVDIFHALAIPLIMARTIPWDDPKVEIKANIFYVRQPEVLEPRHPISIQRETEQREESWKRTPFAKNPPILPLLKIPASPLNLVKGQRWSNNQDRKSFIILPKQAFRAGPERNTKEDCAATEKMKIWKTSNEFGQDVLCYTRHHLSMTHAKVEC